MATKNEHTCDEIKSRVNSKSFDENFDKIFRVQEKKFDDTVTNGELLDELKEEK